MTAKGNVPNGLVYRALKAGYYTNKTFTNQTDLSGEFETGSLQHSFDVGFEYSNIKQDKDSYTQTIAKGAMPCKVGANDASNPALCTSLWGPDPHDYYPGHLSRNDNPARYSTDTIALYGFDTIKFNEQWQASVGLRWDNYRVSGKISPAARNDPASTPAFYSTSREDNLFNYQLGLAYKPVPNGTIYASYGTSSTPSAVAGSNVSDAVTVSNESLAPEKSRTVEVGTKWQLFDDRLTLSGALFQDIRKNTSVAVSATETEQIGKAKVRGIELGFSGSITPKWNVYGGYTFMDSELVGGRLQQRRGGPGPAQHAAQCLQPVDHLQAGASADRGRRRLLRGQRYMATRTTGAMPTAHRRRAGVPVLALRRHGRVRVQRPPDRAAQRDEHLRQDVLHQGLRGALRRWLGRAAVLSFNIKY